MLVNMHETSTGVLYDMSLVGDFCKNNGLFLVVDAISAFMADTVEMEKWGIDVLVLSSQKALAKHYIFIRDAMYTADFTETLPEAPAVYHQDFICIAERINNSHLHPCCA